MVENWTITNSFSILLSSVWRTIKVAAAAIVLFLILLPQPIEILLRSPVNYLCWKKCNRTQVTFRGGIVLHDKSDRQRFIKEVQCHFACWQAHLKASLPFTKILSIMDKAQSLPTHYDPIWLLVSALWKRWVNCALWLWTNLQVNNIFPSG